MPFGSKFQGEEMKRPLVSARLLSATEEVTMKISKMVFAAMFATGLGSSCAYAQTTTATTSATVTFTAVVTHVDLAASKISLTQPLPTKPAAIHDSPTATADYLAGLAVLNAATVGAVVQATVEWINGYPAVISLQTPAGTVSATPTVTASSAPTSTSSNPLVSNPARLTPSGH
jgi:hypothetical protein